mmetsp:Transcript_14909/g.18178  ORF Transcript_14909/g.18178 Transcript_14909/m.18178 type:complete len:487 (-) Transcript_14909:3713-5173(-)
MTIEKSILDSGPVIDMDIEGNSDEPLTRSPDVVREGGTIKHTEEYDKNDGEEGSDAEVENGKSNSDVDVESPQYAARREVAEEQKNNRGPKTSIDEPEGCFDVNTDVEEERDVPIRFDTKEVTTLNLIEQQELIEKSTPSTELEIVLINEIKRKDAHIERLTGEVMKLKQFISKRKQTYKRKRKDDGAPTRALSAYNIFIQDRFLRLAKENEKALKSTSSDAILKRVPPASLVASTGNQWKDLAPEKKAMYEERAKTDRKRYEVQMAKYQPPDKQANKKRNKTGYNMFFSHHVNDLKQSESGVPSERGSVARLVGNAWKELSNDQKQYFEREADKQNGMGDEDEDPAMQDEEKRRQMEYSHGPPVMTMDPNVHRHMMPPQMGHAPVVHQPSHHDPRIPYPPPPPHGHYHPYPPPYYDYPPYPHAPPPPHQPGTGERGEGRGHQHNAQGPPPQQYPGPPPPHYHPPPHYLPHPEQRHPHSMDHSNVR